MVIVFVWLCAVGLLPPQRAGHHRRPALSPRRGPNSSCTGCAHSRARRAPVPRTRSAAIGALAMAALVVTLCRTPPVHGMLAHTEGMRCIFRNCGDFVSGHAHEPRNIIRSRPPRCAGDGRGGTRARRPGVPDGRTRAHAFLSETVSQLSHVLFCDDPLVEIRSA